MAVEAVGVGSALAVEADLLSDQAVGRVVQLIFFAGFVFDFGQQQPRRVVAVLQLAAVGVQAAADQVQVVGVFVAGDPPLFIALGGDLAVGVVAPGSGGTVGQGHLQQSADGVPLVVRERAVFVLAAEQTPQGVVGKTPATAVGQDLFGQLAQATPGEAMFTTVRGIRRQQLPMGVVGIFRAPAIRVDEDDHVAAGIAPVGPHGLAA